MKRFVVNLETNIIIEADDSVEAEEMKYILLHRLMDVLMKDSEIASFVETSEWLHSKPKEKEAIENATN